MNANANHFLNGSTSHKTQPLQIPLNLIQVNLQPQGSIHNRVTVEKLGTNSHPPVSVSSPNLRQSKKK